MTKDHPLTLSAIVAYDNNFGIGKNNELLWNLPNDLKHFKNLTLNKNILMGRKTYESIGRPLPQRNMIVLTRNHDFHSDYATVIHDLAELNKIIPANEELLIIGGAEIFKMLLPKTNKLYITEVDTALDADAFFPQLNPSEWTRHDEEHHDKDERHAYPYTFVTLIRHENPR